MKRSIKMLAVTCVAALALTALMAAGAAAAAFTWSEVGTLTGANTTDQVFTVDSTNKVTCKKSHTTGTIISKEPTELHVTVKYTECTASFFGFPAGAAVSVATYKYTANGQVHIENTISIKVVSLGCETVVKPQTRESATYTNNSGKLQIANGLTGIVSSSPNGCPSGNAGTYSGSSLVELVGGGSISWDK